MSRNCFLYLMILLLRSQPKHNFLSTCFILWMLVMHVVVISHLTTLIALLGLHLQWKLPSCCRLWIWWIWQARCWEGTQKERWRWQSWQVSPCAVIVLQEDCWLQTAVFFILILCLIIWQKIKKIFSDRNHIQFYKPNSIDKLIFIFQQLNCFSKYPDFGS